MGTQCDTNNTKMATRLKMLRVWQQYYGETMGNVCLNVKNKRFKHMKHPQKVLR
jgi:hypothetical protein